MTQYLSRFYYLCAVFIFGWFSHAKCNAASLKSIQNCQVTIKMKLGESDMDPELVKGIIEGIKPDGTVACGTSPDSPPIKFKYQFDSPTDEARYKFVGWDATIMNYPDEKCDKKFPPDVPTKEAEIHTVDSCNIVGHFELKEVYAVAVGQSFEQITTSKPILLANTNVLDSTSEWVKKDVAVDYYQFYDVSCTKDGTACFAVGIERSTERCYQNKSIYDVKPLLYFKDSKHPKDPDKDPDNPQAWTRLEIDDVPESGFGGFNRIKCLKDFCLAVGYVYTSNCQRLEPRPYMVKIQLSPDHPVTQESVNRPDKSEFFGTLVDINCTKDESKCMTAGHMYMSSVGNLEPVNMVPLVAYNNDFNSSNWSVYYSTFMFVDTPTPHSLPYFDLIYLKAAGISCSNQFCTIPLIFERPPPNESNYLIRLTPDPDAMMYVFRLTDNESTHKSIVFSGWDCKNDSCFVTFYDGLGHSHSSRITSSATSLNQKSIPAGISEIKKLLCLTSSDFDCILIALSTTDYAPFLYKFQSNEWSNWDIKDSSSIKLSNINSFFCFLPNECFLAGDISAGDGTTATKVFLAKLNLTPEATWENITIDPALEGTLNAVSGAIIEPPTLTKRVSKTKKSSKKRFAKKKTKKNVIVDKTK